MPKSKITLNNKNKQVSKVNRTAKAKPKTKGTTYARVGKFVGNLINPTLGQLGSHVGSAIDRIMGHGDYKINSNTLLSNQAPQFSSTNNGMRICHREYVADQFSSIPFTNISYQINPGNKKLFPWLSTIAGSFETYEFHGLVVMYKPLSGTAISSTNPAQGSVIYSTNYDVLNPSFQSKQEAEAYQYTTSCVPYNSMIHPIECKVSQTPLPHKYITDKQDYHELSSDDDPRLHYHGAFQSMVVGQQSTSASLGEMWVSYDVSLFTPKIPQQDSNAGSMYVGVITNASNRYIESYRMEPHNPAVTIKRNSTNNKDYWNITQPGNYAFIAHAQREALATPSVTIPFEFAAFGTDDRELRNFCASGTLLQDNPYSTNPIMGRPISNGESLCLFQTFGFKDCTSTKPAGIYLPFWSNGGTNVDGIKITNICVRLGGEYNMDILNQFGNTTPYPTSSSLTFELERLIDLKLRSLTSRCDQTPQVFSKNEVVVEDEDVVFVDSVAVKPQLKQSKSVSNAFYRPL
jgi:hypothetical protein